MKVMRVTFQPGEEAITKVMLQKKMLDLRKNKGFTGCSGNIKKSNRHTGKLTEAIYLETANKDRNMREQGGRRLNVSGVLRHLGVSRS